mgnify:CR=1 FL=1
MMPPMIVLLLFVMVGEGVASRRGGREGEIGKEKRRRGGMVVEEAEVPDIKTEQVVAEELEPLSYHLLVPLTLSLTQGRIRA